MRDAYWIFYIDLTSREKSLPVAFQLLYFLFHLYMQFILDMKA